MKTIIEAIDIETAALVIGGLVVMVAMVLLAMWEIGNRGDR